MSVLYTCESMSDLGHAQLTRGPDSGRRNRILPDLVSFLSLPLPSPRFFVLEPPKRDLGTRSPYNSVQKCIIPCNYNYKKTRNLIGPETLLLKINQLGATRTCRDLTCCYKTIACGHKALTVANLLTVNVNDGAVCSVCTLNFFLST